MVSMERSNLPVFYYIQIILLFGILSSSSRVVNVIVATVRAFFVTEDTQMRFVQVFPVCRHVGRCPIFEQKTPHTTRPFVLDNRGMELPTFFVFCFFIYGFTIPSWCNGNIHTLSLCNSTVGMDLYMCEIRKLVSQGLKQSCREWRAFSIVVVQ